MTCVTEGGSGGRDGRMYTVDTDVGLPGVTTTLVGDPGLALPASA